VLFDGDGLGADELVLDLSDHARPADADDVAHLGVQHVLHVDLARYDLQLGVDGLGQGVQHPSPHLRLDLLNVLHLVIVAEAHDGVGLRIRCDVGHLDVVGDLAVSIPIHDLEVLAEAMEHAKLRDVVAVNVDGDVGLGEDDGTLREGLGRLVVKRAVTAPAVELTRPAKVLRAGVLPFTNEGFDVLVGQPCDPGGFVYRHLAGMSHDTGGVEVPCVGGPDNFLRGDRGEPRPAI
jgi:hypothetical protein